MHLYRVSLRKNDASYDASLLIVRYYAVNEHAATGVAAGAVVVVVGDFVRIIKQPARDVLLLPTI
jgi:hypothetical protein